MTGLHLIESSGTILLLKFKPLCKSHKVNQRDMDEKARGQGAEQWEKEHMISHDWISLKKYSSLSDASSLV